MLQVLHIIFNIKHQCIIKYNSLELHKTSVSFLCSSSQVPSVPSQQQLIVQDSGSSNAAESSAAHAWHEQTQDSKEWRAPSRDSQKSTEHAFIKTPCMQVCYKYCPCCFPTGFCLSS